MPDIPVTLPLGGFDGGQAAADQRSGTYGAGSNVRSVDQRSKRLRLSRRPGLANVSDDPVVVEGEEVTALFRIGRDTIDDRYRLLTTTALEGVTPPAAAVEWERTLPSEPLAIAAGPDGRLAYVVMDSGAVAVVNAKGDITETIPSQRPVNFQTVDSIAIDELGAVYVGYAFSMQDEEDKAGLIVRMVKSDRGDWERGWAAPLAGTLVHFVYDKSVMFAAVQAPEDVETVAPSAVVRLTGVTTSVPVEAWVKPVAHPVIRLAVNDKGDLFVASRPNPDRPLGDPGVLSAPSISWTPMEPVTLAGPILVTETPANELYWWTSAERASTVQGYYNGQRMSTWVESRRDPSVWDPVIDVEPTSSVIGRGFTALVVSGTVTPGPDMDSDAAGLGTKPGVYFNGVEAAARRLTSRSSFGSHEKASEEGYAPHQRAVLPTMWDGAPSVGACYVTTWACRVLNWAEGAITLATWKVIFQQGSTVLDYRETPAATTMDVRFVHAGITRTVTLAGSTSTNPTTIIFSFLFAGIGVATSEVWVNGLQVGADLNVAANGDGVRTVIGGPGPTGSGAGIKGWIFEIVTYLGPTTTLPHDTRPTDTCRAYLEGFVAHRYGLQAALDASHAYDVAPPAATGDTLLDTRGFGVSEATGLLVKYSSAGEPRWWVGGGNVGNGVVCGPDGRVFTAGTPLPTGAGPTARVTMMRDMGSTVVSSGPTTWTFNFEYTDQWARPGVDLRLDAYGNLYLPYSIAGAGSTRQFRRYKRDGLLPAAPFASLDWQLEMNTAADTDEVPLAVAGIGDAIDVPTANGYVGLWAITRNDSFQIRRIATIGTLDAPREGSRDVALLSVTSSGAVRRLSATKTWTPLIAGAFTGIRPWIATVYPFSVIGDGVNPYRVLDHRSMLLREFESSTKGEVPQRSPVGFAYRRRVGVLDANARHRLAFSAFGNVFDWDPARDIVTATQAVTTRFSAAAEYPDLIRNVCPWNDDLAIVMCDGSFWRQTGDPMTGGQQDQLIAGLGLADDWAWTRDTQGALYFLGTDRRVWRMGADGQREPLTGGTIWALMGDIDLTAYRIEFAWSMREDALWVLVLPRTGSPVDVEHYVWERAANAWHPQRFGGGSGRVVTAVGSFDGDGPDDVSTLLGFTDGRVRRIDQYAVDDAGIPVGSHVTIGPLVGHQGIEAHLVALDVTLALDGGGVSVGARGSNFADAPGSVRRMMDVPVRRRARMPLNLRAPHVWIDIVGRDGLPWSVEELSLNVAAGGQRRNR